MFDTMSGGFYTQMGKTMSYFPSTNDFQLHLSQHCRLLVRRSICRAEDNLWWPPPPPTPQQPIHPIKQKRTVHQICYFTVGLQEVLWNLRYTTPNPYPPPSPNPSPPPKTGAIYYTEWGRKVKFWTKCKLVSTIFQLEFEHVLLRNSLQKWTRYNIVINIVYSRLILKFLHTSNNY